MAVVVYGGGGVGCSALEEKVDFWGICFATKDLFFGRIE